MPESRQRSVRRQLLVLLLTAVSIAWIIAATVSFEMPGTRSRRCSMHISRKRHH